MACKTCEETRRIAKAILKYIKKKVNPPSQETVDVTNLNSKSRQYKAGIKKKVKK